MSLSLIQNHIISKLKNADTLRYRDIRPEDVPNDLFNYHLKTLVNRKLVDKREEGYGLSENGRRYVADIHHTSDESNRLFKLNVITIVSRVNEGRVQILTQRRLSQPSYGQVGVMGGTIVKDESLVDGAARKLVQETGLIAEFRVVGFERRRLYKSGELFSDVVFPICYSGNAHGTLQETTDFGENYWVGIDQAIKNDTRPYDSIASVPEVLRAIKDARIDSFPMFYNETVQQDS